METRSPTDMTPGDDRPSPPTVHAFVICGFPGVGKSSFARTHVEFGGRQVVDFDPFAGSRQADGSRAPGFFDAYFARLAALLRRPIVLLVPSHAEIRRWLAVRDVPFALLLPPREAKAGWIEARIRSRGTEEVARVLEDRWDEFLTDCEGYADRANGSCCRVFHLAETETVADVLDCVVKSLAQALISRPRIITDGHGFTPAAPRVEPS